MSNFRVEFWKPKVAVADEEERTTFTSILEQLSELSLRERIRAGTNPIALIDLEDERGEFVGEAAKIRMDDLPRVINVASGALRNVDITETEGLGDEIHFLYHKTLDVLAVQKKGQFQVATLRQFLSDLSELPLRLEPILRQDAWDRFNRMDTLKRVSFKFARPADIGGVTNRAVYSVLQELNEFEGVSARLEISVEREHRSLARNAVESVVDFFRHNREDFRSFQVAGMENEGSTEVIDFIKAGLLYEDDVPYRNRRLDRDACRLALRRSIREHREYLRRFVET